MARKTYYVAPGRADETDTKKTTLVRNLNKQLLKRGWRQTDLAREAARFMPAGKEFGRHLVSSYLTGKNMPNPINLEAMAKALGCEVTDLIPATAVEYVGMEPPAMTMSFTTDGKARVTLDLEMSADKAAKIMSIINER